MIGLVGFGALMFSGRFGRGRRISWGEQEKQRRIYLRQLDEDRDEVQRAAQEQRRSQLFLHADPLRLATVIGGPRMWERRPGDPDFLDVRLGIGVQSTADSAVSLQWPEVPIAEELEPVTGGRCVTSSWSRARFAVSARCSACAPGPGSASSGRTPTSCTR